MLLTKKLCLFWISRSNKPARPVGEKQNFFNIKTCDIYRNFLLNHSFISNSMKQRKLGEADSLPFRQEFSDIYRSRIFATIQYKSHNEVLLSVHTVIVGIPEEQRPRIRSRRGYVAMWIIFRPVSKKKEVGWINLAHFNICEWNLVNVLWSFAFDESRVIRWLDKRKWTPEESSHYLF